MVSKVSSPCALFVLASGLSLGLGSACGGPNFSSVGIQPGAANEGGSDVDNTPIILPAPAPMQSVDDGGDATMDGAEGDARSAPTADATATVAREDATTTSATSGGVSAEAGAITTDSATAGGGAIADAGHQPTADVMPGVDAAVKDATGMKKPSDASPDVGCPSGYASCAGGCAELSVDPHNCGTCGNDCSALSNVAASGLACHAGRCSYQCAPDYADCTNAGTGCATSLRSTQTCGACNITCSGADSACALGDAGSYACTVVCPAGTTNCNATCADLTSDSKNCGACGRSCPAGTRCSGSQCVCDPTKCGACASGQCINVKSVAAGTSNTCALLANETVVCWGANSVGELGTGNTGSGVTAPSLGATAMLSGTAVAITAGRAFACALLGGGSVTCWGFNGAGMLGDQTVLDEASPVAVSGLTNTVSAVAAGHGHACALYVGGGMACWGDNYYGEIGDGTNTNDLSAVSVLGVTGVSAIAPGVGDATLVEHTCALLANNTVQCWGDDTYGELGDGTTTSRPTAASVQGLSGTISAIAAGGYHTCVVLASGVVECWGGNTYGQLGNSSTTNSSTPVTVAGLAGPAIGIAAGDQHTCALLRTGTVQCWGFNSQGQLGTGVATTGSPFGITSPGSAGQVAGLSGVTQISAGGAHTCALVGANGPVMCWGYNGSGQLGNGTTVDAYEPVAVQW